MNLAAVRLPDAHFLTAEDVYQPTRQYPEHTPVEAAVFRWWRHPEASPAPMRLQMKGPWPTELLDAPVAEARVDHSRWLVDCPFPSPSRPDVPCRAAQYASKTDKRFLCIECGNGGTGKWARVQWPDETEVAAIEAALSLRPDPATRNWLSGFRAAQLGLEAETVGDLLGENRDHGVA